MTKLVIKNGLMKLVLGAAQGPEGIQGPPGPPGGTGIVLPAGAALGGHRVVILDANGTLQYASALNLAHAQRVVGMTLNAAAHGDDMSIQNFGPVTEATWNWDVSKPVYLGDNGVLTQIDPSTAGSKFSLILGFPETPKTLFLNISNPIILS